MEDREPATKDPEGPEGGEPERPVFLHPDWMVGVVLILAVVAILAGLEDPVWLLIGSPFILTLIVYVWVRLSRR